ncbi:MAG: flavohemoglobin expression-modulating QEGLA motif protein, partial [Acidobacteriota bacterium]|nr:flavohemoglobin expression-modulating QEGLA motif protein [Acidobacteriota bacterium]
GLSWPPEVRERFLERWHAGDRALPEVEPRPARFDEAADELRAVADACDAAHPLGAYVRRTAESYLTAARMLSSAGTPEFTHSSVALYGAPGDPIAPGAMSNVEAADHFIRYSESFRGTAAMPEQEFCIVPEAVRDHLQRVADEAFPGETVEVVLDPGLSSKAAAGARRVRVRAGTCFADVDFAQLAEHEVLVHTLTMLNGRLQPRLGSLGLGAPRTTCTQEGLATTAELITGAVDLGRLRRIALRIRAVAMGLEGADFLDVFSFFLEAGQSPRESFSSTMRVFRGGDPAGKGVVFTKDAVYLQGMLSVHTFLRKALQAERIELIHRLFAGRMTLGDVLALEPWFESGLIEGPRFEPAWVKNRHTLAAYLVYSLFVNRIQLDMFELDFFRDR